MDLHALYRIIQATPSAPVSNLDITLFLIKSTISFCGTIIILIGVITALLRYLILRFFTKKNITLNYGEEVDYVRRDLGRIIVLGLEFIIAADVIETTTTPNYYSLGILGITVLIRTFLSITLNREITQLSSAKQEEVEK